MFLAAAGCTRAPLAGDCVDIPAGALVITELRGDQSGDSDTLGEWVEIHNTTSASIDLFGLRLATFRIANGLLDADDFVRATDLSIAPGDYVVLGVVNAAGIDPIGADYTFEGSLRDHVRDGAIIELRDCRQALVDRVIFRDAPSDGTLSYDGALTPDASNNDDSDDAVWCVDVAGVTPPGESGSQGSPGEENRQCD